MQALKATLAREINKADITEAETLVFEGRVLRQTGKQSMEPGEFFFRMSSVPATIEPRWLLRIFGAKAKASWVSIPTVVMACPFCSTPIMTQPGHTIEHRSPLTISGQITCPYAPDAPHSFKVVEGNIMTA